MSKEREFRMLAMHRAALVRASTCEFRSPFISQCLAALKSRTCSSQRAIWRGAVECLTKERARRSSSFSMSAGVQKPFIQTPQHCGHMRPNIHRHRHWRFTTTSYRELKNPRDDYFRSKFRDVLRRPAKRSCFPRLGGDRRTDNYVLGVPRRVGTTTIATNLSGRFENKRRRTVLVDLGLQTGDAVPRSTRRRADQQHFAMPLAIRKRVEQLLSTRSEAHHQPSQPVRLARAAEFRSDTSRRMELLWLFGEPPPIASLRRSACKCCYE